MVRRLQPQPPMSTYTRLFALALATATFGAAQTGCAATEEADDSSSDNAITLGGKAWLEEGIYDLAPKGAGSPTGTLLVRKKLVGYDVDARATVGVVPNVTLGSGSRSSGDAVTIDAELGCGLTLKEAPGGKVSVTQDPSCAASPKLDGVYTRRDHAKVVGKYTSGGSQITITESSADAVAFRLRPTGAPEIVATGSVVNAVLVSAKLDGGCTLSMFLPEAPFRSIELDTKGCQKRGLADRYVFTR